MPPVIVKASADETSAHNQYLNDIEAKGSPSPVVPLGVHTDFSITDSLLTVNSYISLAKEKGYSTLSIADLNSSFGVIDFYDAARKAGIKPILGTDITVARTDGTPFRMRLYAQNDAGLHNIYQLISIANTRVANKEIKEPIVPLADVARHANGVIACCGFDSELGTSEMESDKLLGQYAKIFGDRLYLEVSRTGRPGEDEFNQKAAALSQQFNVPMVAANPARFAEAKNLRAHELRTAIANKVSLDGTKHVRDVTAQQYLRSPQEMTELFADIPEAIENTSELAKRCNVSISLNSPALPSFPIGKSEQGAEILDELAEQNLPVQQLQEQAAQRLLGALAHEGLNERLTKSGKTDPESLQAYQERLDYELSVINQMGFASYFLIVQDFVKWAHDNDILVGPGRGSGAGSLAAYALKIINIDPVEQDLLFERFLNPERVSMPDFDIDFDAADRDAVVDYVAQLYGRERVSEISAFNSLTMKNAVKRTASALGLHVSLGDKINGLISDDVKSLREAIGSNPQLRQLYDAGGDEAKILKGALSVENIITGWSSHGAGVVIAPNGPNGAPESITHYGAITYPQDEPTRLIALEKDAVEKANLVKFDFLPLRNLTTIKKAVANIKESQGQDIDMDSIPADDAKTFAMLREGKSDTVFQLASEGMKELLGRLQPDSVKDLMDVLALYRPGPLESGMVDDFIACKHGHKPIASLHPALDEVLKPTYGVLLYQEQVMQAAQKVAGYTLAEADLLRRAMGKKKPEEMAKERSRFVEGAVARGTERQKASDLFDLIDKFSGYGFNKSHTAAYAKVAYQTAYLKANYPVEYMAAELSNQQTKDDRKDLIAQTSVAQRMGLTLQTPDINQSIDEFKPAGGNAIRYSLGAISGMKLAASSIVEERNKNGAYADFTNAYQRLTNVGISKNQFTSLIDAGVFDSLGSHRALLHADLDSLVKSNKPAYNRDRIKEWDLKQVAEKEMQALGVLLSDNPFSKHAARFQSILTPVNDVKLNSQVCIGGLVTERSKALGKGDKKWSTFTLRDDAGSDITCKLFSKEHAQYRSEFKKGDMVLVRGKAGTYKGGPMEITVSKVSTVESVLAAMGVEDDAPHQTEEKPQVADLSETAGQPSSTDEPKESPIPKVKLPVFAINLSAAMQEKTDDIKQKRKMLFDTIKANSAEGLCAIYVRYGDQAGTFMDGWKVSPDSDTIASIMSTLKQIDPSATALFVEEDDDTVIAIDQSAAQVSDHDVDGYMQTVKNDPQNQPNMAVGGSRL